MNHSPSAKPPGAVSRLAALVAAVAGATIGCDAQLPAALVPNTNVVYDFEDPAYVVGSPPPLFTAESGHWSVSGTPTDGKSVVHEAPDSPPPSTAAVREFDRLVYPDSFSSGSELWVACQLEFGTPERTAHDTAGVTWGTGDGGAMALVAKRSSGTAELLRFEPGGSSTIVLESWPIDVDLSVDTTLGVRSRSGELELFVSNDRWALSSSRPLARLANPEGWLREAAGVLAARQAVVRFDEIELGVFYP
ncbi:MAG: hypothetical protein H6828_01820 [Planctomycetes bacterium]|nr:hypothetical protein [Planctomycetota bacterium]